MLLLTNSQPIGVHFTQYPFNVSRIAFEVTNTRQLCCSITLALVSGSPALQ